MWKTEHCQRLREQERRAKRYATDVSDAGWAVIKPLLPRPAKRGWQRSIDLRDVIDAIRYLARTGCGWRMLPNELPPWHTKEK